MIKIYTVSTVSTTDDKLNLGTVGRYKSKTAAMYVAKKLAGDAKDCQVYGPSALAYCGTKTTAVVAWENRK
jgi:hypothetical protein